MELYFRELGEGQPLVFLHGIFGSSDNWLTSARNLSDAYRTFAVDLRNHGHSPHDAAFDYPAMVDDLLTFIREKELRDAVLVGHSMGGKVAMNFALAHPDQLQKLVVVDIAPKGYNMSTYVELQGLQAIDIDAVKSRGEADEALAAFVPEAAVRQFLLKNLKRKPDGGFEWKLNLDAIAANIEHIGVGPVFEGSFEKPTLLVRGSRSRYVKDDDVGLIKKIFPKAEIATLDAGHWVPAEKPDEFVETLREWLGRSGTAGS